MQRDEDGGIVISCDFCGADWDPYDESFSNPMIEGHRGSVICLQCLKKAVGEMSSGSAFDCTLCLRQNMPADRPRWFHPAPVPSAGLNPTAVACRGCIQRAARQATKDEDIDWEWDGA